METPQQQSLRKFIRVLSLPAYEARRSGRGVLRTLRANYAHSMLEGSTTLKVQILTARRDA